MVDMKILVAGDFVPKNRLVPIMAGGKYEPLFNSVKEIISSTDYSLVNLECPIVEDGDKPISKYGPNLQCSSKVVEAIKFAGFKCATLANNHIRDFGDVAVKRTMLVLRNNGIDTVGAGENLDAAAIILYHQHDGKTLAVINCCENEFSTATKNHFGANPLNVARQYYAITEAKKNANYVLLIVHGGHEHFQLPSPRMVETYRFFIDAGADAVVNHHQHCYSGYETYKGKPIFYGIGNFCFDNPVRRKGSWTEGYMVAIDFSLEKPTYEIYPYNQCADEPRIELLAKDAFDARLKEINTIISDSCKLQTEVNKYYSGCMNNYENVFEPIRNRFYLAAKKRGLVPSLVNKGRKLMAYDFINCESHRDKMLYWLKNND